MTNNESIIREFADAAEEVVPHRFDLVRQLGDGTEIPVEALSDDHSIGIYADVAPLKMREQVHAFRPIALAELAPRLRAVRTPAGMDIRSFVEYVPLRGVRFRSEKLQYLEEGWTATLPEVEYPTHSVLAMMNLIHERFGTVLTYLNTELPMPLWLRSHPLGEDGGIQVALQVYATGRVRPTNIHTECTMAYARSWVEAAHGYFDPVDDDAVAPQRSEAGVAK